MAALCLLAALILPLCGFSDPAPGAVPGFLVSFPGNARADAVTGRVYVAISRDNRRPPIRQVGETGVPLFGKNVEQLTPGQQVRFGADASGYPLGRLGDLPAGDYYVQAFVNVYTRFPRADGHTVWLHMDRWEGQNWRRAPGNLYSTPRRVRLDPAAPTVVELSCDQVIPVIEVPKDTAQVKRFRIESQLLSRWWGHPIYLGATVLLPHGYDDHPDVHYPVAYIQGHFSTAAPGRYGRGGITGVWHAPDTPRYIWVTLQHPSPYYDDSYGVNSANNGPYGDALVTELIPEVERRFRVIRKPWARKLTGGSTGGWIALAMQIFHPDFFGGCWASYPDPVDFRYHQIVNIYDDENAYWLQHDWMRVERPTRRRTDGNIVSMMKDENWFELAVGDRSRSGGQWDIWEATFSPVGPDGYPQRIWDKRTGKIDRAVADHWRENYDLRHILQSRWSTLGPKLVGKLHVYVGDMDDYYLNNGVRLLGEFLEATDAPAYAGSVEFARLRGHGWGPRGKQLLDLMTEHIGRVAPDGADLQSWRY